ncbi:MAG: thiamine pyrophosphate-dependent dehydrogenase E1 component subunit alpha [Vulcanimicrobiota bacterium]
MSIDLQRAYRLMLLTRRVEEQLVNFYRQNKVVGGVYRSLGQEAISVGSGLALEGHDLVAPLIRNLAIYLLRDYRPRDVFTQYMAKATSPTAGRDCNTHFGSVERGVIAPISMLGAMIPVMVGMGWAARQQGKTSVALTYIGDGGTSTGDFHEGLNLASVLKAPFVLIGEHNQYAYSTPTSHQMAITDLAERVKAYAIPSLIVDGNDVEAVFEATREALAHARSGAGPFFVECKTMRMTGHAAHDDARYVPKELFEEWKKKDPLDRLRARLKKKDLTAIEAEVEALIKEDAAFAEQSPSPDPAGAYGGVFQ